MTIRRVQSRTCLALLKHWTGSTYFQTRPIGRVATEMSLHVLAYNLKRVIKILGFEKAMDAMKRVGA